VFALVIRPDEVVEREHREVRAQADSPERLLVAWINECLYVHEIEGFVVHDVEMTVCTDTLAHGYLHGEPLDQARHRIGGVVKGATYHQTALTVQEGVHEARLIVDV
jgi:protein archease